jgi:hypothetical protein
LRAGALWLLPERVLLAADVDARIVYQRFEQLMCSGRMFLLKSITGKCLQHKVVRA